MIRADIFLVDKLKWMKLSWNIQNQLNFIIFYPWKFSLFEPLDGREKPQNEIWKRLGVKRFIILVVTSRWMWLISTVVFFPCVTTISRFFDNFLLLSEIFKLYGNFALHTHNTFKPNTLSKTLSLLINKPIKIQIDYLK